LKTNSSTRCFPHVINLCVKAGLKRLTSIYDHLILDDPVAAARTLATALRATGQRREDLETVIIEGHESGRWTEEEIPNVVALKDMDVRWSATFLMIDRVLLLYRAIKVFLAMEKNASMRDLGLSDEQLVRLAQIRKFLEIPHTVQEALSADKTPTLPIALPAYEELLAMLKDFLPRNPEIAHGVQASIDKLEEYYRKSRVTPIYTASMGE
ncbi:ribonuclease H-like domain-containing protein, partial [Coprinopsis sp. MPI-PUGE-AT-0042]